MPANTATDRRPNVLWISFEDTYPFYGCYGDPVARTPNVDRLAAEGCRYPNAFSTAPVCAPARCAVITGMYAVSIGAHHMRTSHPRPHDTAAFPYEVCPPPHVRCFTEYLRAAGYYCTNNHKTDYQFNPPRTAWDDCSKTAHWRNRPDPDQPFFAVFNPTNTHESGMWEDKDIELSVDPAAVPVPPYLPDTPRVRESIARMYSQLAIADQRMGELLAQLEEDGLADNTIIMHWSDHGPMPRGKRWPYDSGIRVPMIVRWPDRLRPRNVKPGSVDERLVSTIDLGPTVLSLAGVEIPVHLQGRAFLGPRAAPPRDYVFASRDRYDVSYDMIRAARDRRFKYLRNYLPQLEKAMWVPYRNQHPIMQEIYRLHLEGRLEGPQRIMMQTSRLAEELYDTHADPHELHNLAADPAYAGDLARLGAATDAWLAEVGDMGRIDEYEMVRRWWPGGKQPRTSKPLLIPIAPGCWGDQTVMKPEDVARPVTGEYTGPMLVQLTCGTQGASIAYTTEAGDAARWQLYAGPIRIEKGKTVTIRARACRIGYQESEEAAATFTAT